MSNKLSYENINNLTIVVKKARERALKGLYKDSYDSYRLAMTIIQERIKEIDNVNIKDQWLKTGKNLKEEYNEIKEIIELCSTFKMDKREDINKNYNKHKDNQLILRDYLDKNDYNNVMNFDNNDNNYIKNNRHNSNNNVNRINNNNYQDPHLDKRFERFGGKLPFEHHNDVNIKNILNDKNEIKNNKYIKNSDNYINRRNSNQVGYNNKGKEFKLDVEIKRNYEKPWRNNNENEKKIKNKEDKQVKNNKSAFYLHHYPDGDGPDGILIETLEGEVLDKNPGVQFEDIAELDEAKNILKEAVLLPILMPDFFTGIRRPWRGVLLYGPPGTGKTMLAKALATQGKTVFFNVSASTFASKWRGESEKLIRLLFEMAKFYAPSVIFIDEVDSIGSKRGSDDSEASRRVKSELLVQMDGANSNNSANSTNSNDKEANKIVMVMGATNKPWDLDEALRRRFEKRVYIPLPNDIGRKEMFKINLKEVSIEDNIKFDNIVKETEGYSGADIANVCREAALMQMRRKLLNKSGDIMDIINKPDFEKELQAPITENDLFESIKNISKSVSKNDLEEYYKWTKEFSSC